MKQIYVVPDKEKDINNILSKDIQGIILGVNNLSIYNSELDIDKIISISNNTNKKVIIAINKMIHNKDLELVKEVLNKIKNTNIYGVLFYDLGILKLANEMNIDKELILSQEHLNASINSNNFYNKRNIKGSLITSDITCDELLEIKEKTNMNIYYTVYGYLPIFYSRRYLITNYFKYINKEVNSDKYYIFDKDNKYLIKEREYGTIIYSPLVNLINNINKLKDINMVIDLSYTDDLNTINKFINEEKEENVYEGFFNTKTIYKLRSDNNE